MRRTMNRSIHRHSVTTPTTSEQRHDDGLSPHLSPLDSPAAFGPRPIKHLSHKSSKTLRAQRAPRACWSPRHSFPAPPLSWAASAFRNPHPGARTLSASHGTPRGSWLCVWGGRGGCHRWMSLWFSARRLMCETQADASCEINKSIFLKRRGSVHMPVSQSTASHARDKRLSYHTIQYNTWPRRHLYYSVVCCYYCNTAKYAHSVVNLCVL